MLKFSKLRSESIHGDTDDVVVLKCHKNLSDEKIGETVRYSHNKKKFCSLSKCRYCADRAQSLPEPVPNIWLIMFQISSKSVHFRRSYSWTRKGCDLGPWRSSGEYLLMTDYNAVVSRADFFQLHHWRRLQWRLVHVIFSYLAVILRRLLQLTFRWVSGRLLDKLQSLRTPGDWSQTFWPHHTCFARVPLASWWLVHVIFSYLAVILSRLLQLEGSIRVVATVQMAFLQSYACSATINWCLCRLIEHKSLLFSCLDNRR